MKPFFLVCFVAGLILILGWTAANVYGLVTHSTNLRNLPFSVLAIVVLLYITRQMFLSYRQRS